MAYTLPSGSHSITLARAVEMTTLYRQLKTQIIAPSYDPSILCISETFNKGAIEKLLATTGASGIRIYYGMDENYSIHAILVAVNAAGQDILPEAGTSLREGDDDETIIVEDGQKCPPFCPDPSPLNP